jgi:acyl carrier protein
MNFSQFLSDFCGQFEDEKIEMKGDANFRKLESWDSLTGMAVLYMIESNYGVTITPDEFIKLETPEDIFKYIQEKVKS